MRKAICVMALGISGRARPLFLPYCVLGINYFIASQCSDFFLLASSSSMRKYCRKYFASLFQIQHFIREKIHQRDIIFMRGYIRKQNQWNCWLNYSFAFQRCFSNIYQCPSNANNTLEETTLNCTINF